MESGIGLQLMLPISSICVTPLSIEKSGVELPAVTATVYDPTNQLFSRSVAVSTW